MDDEVTYADIRTFSGRVTERGNEGESRRERVVQRSPCAVRWLYGGAASLCLLLLLGLIYLRVRSCEESDLMGPPSQNCTSAEGPENKESTQGGESTWGLHTCCERERQRAQQELRDSLDPSQVVWCRQEQRQTQPGGYLFCSVGWLCLQGTCYFVSQKEKKTWDRSRDFCVGQGGRLLQGEGERKRVTEQGGLISGSYWVGLHDRGRGEWYWEDGNTYLGSIQDMMPNSGCASLDVQGVRAWPCILQKNWICSRDAETARILQINHERLRKN